MKISDNEIRVGMLLEYKDDLWEVLKTQHVKPGKGGAFAQVEMKSLNKNTKFCVSVLHFAGMVPSQGKIKMMFEVLKLLLVDPLKLNAKKG